MVRIYLRSYPGVVVSELWSVLAEGNRMTRQRLEAMRTMIHQAQTDPNVRRDFMQFYARELIEWCLWAQEHLETLHVEPREPYEVSG